MANRRYDAREVEQRLLEMWAQEGVYDFQRDADVPVFCIDTPPPTVSGHLHAGTLYSYSHVDFIARFRRMRGDNVYYPMGFDDNGLPTERLVEKRLGRTAEEMGREAFVEKCLELSEEFEEEYRALFERLGLSVDWRYTYRTIDRNAQRESQLSFLDLFHQDLVYREEAPAIWCPTCRTAIAQAEVDDLDRESEFVTLAFGIDGEDLPIATTRPELLPACVAVFVHPGDPRFTGVVGKEARLPIDDRVVPVLEDPRADPEKGTGAVMCCTFGDVTDVEWWRLHHLPLRLIVGEDGRLTEAAGGLADRSVAEAHREIVKELREAGKVLDARPVSQTVRVHERCDTPVEYIVTRQWFVRVLDHKDAFLRRGEEVDWIPERMATRYREWVQNLGWDWCISRHRFFGVHFPVWYCRSCGQVVVATAEQLPVDPMKDSPPTPCTCGGTDFAPEEDVMDTWATSSLSPQLAGQRQADPDLYEKVFPMSLHPQAHEIIRTWAFDTIVKSHYNFGSIPWRTVLISGWALAPVGTAKISKSRGGGPLGPGELLDRYSADGVRYWAASTGPGKDSVISEEKMQAGVKLATKLWNVGLFASRFLGGNAGPSPSTATLTVADRWMLASLNRLINAATRLYEEYDYANAKNETESLFWSFTDNYLEMAKKRLYERSGEGFEAAGFTLHTSLTTFLKLFAPVMPFVTDEVYRAALGAGPRSTSLHDETWPEGFTVPEEEDALRAGELLLAVATAVRRYKSDRSLSLGAPLQLVQIAAEGEHLELLQGAEEDLMSVTRAKHVALVRERAPEAERVDAGDGVEVAILP